MKMIIKIIFLIILSGFWGCSSKSKASYSEWNGISESNEIYEEEYRSTKSLPSNDSDLEFSETQGSKDSGDNSSSADQRKRIYSGYLNLMVSEVREAKTQITEIAEESGGYVEQILEFSIIIRIPAGQFFDIFQLIIDYDEVISKSIETYDVTESFKDMEGRLSIAQKTRTRLYNLLERTENINEKLRILQEIRRLTEEIELINSTLEVLKNQISYSRITIDLSPRFQEELYSRQEIPFSWIAAINPLYNTLDSSIKNITLELDNNFAIFDREKFFIAESSDGTIVRVGKTANNPEGDSLFWQKALSYHLDPFYKNSEMFDLDSVKSVLFTSKDNVPYYYLINVFIRNEIIYVIEVFFPDENSLDTNFENVVNSIRSFNVQ